MGQLSVPLSSIIHPRKQRSSTTRERKTMSTYSYHLQRVLPPLSSLMGFLALSGGIYSLVDPPAFGAATLGIPISTSTSSSAIPFVSFAGSRNIGSGITTLALLYLGQRKAVGVSLMCGVVTCLTDAWICSRYEPGEGKAIGHAVMGVIAGLLGAGMWWI